MCCSVCCSVVRTANVCMHMGNRCLIEGTAIYYAITSAHTNTNFSMTQVQQHDYELWINNTSDTCTLKHANTHTYTHTQTSLNNKILVINWSNNHPCVSNISVATHLIDDPTFKHLCPLPNDISESYKSDYTSWFTKYTANL